jgi:gluconolactonase
MTASTAGAILTVALVLVSCAKASMDNSNLAVPPGAVVCQRSRFCSAVPNVPLQYVDPLMYNVLGQNYTEWRNLSTVGFNPTNTTPPFIQVFDPSFLDAIGSSATIRSIASNPGFAFAHEAPIYVPDLNAVFFTSNDGGPLGYNGWYNNSVVSMINMTEVDMALASTTGNVNIQVQTVGWNVC